MAGWVSIHRSITDHWLWKDQPFSKGQAWVHLIMLANHKDNKFLVKSKLIECKRGQIARSLSNLSNEFGWTVKKVRGFLNLLEKENMVSIKKGTVTSVITICKYEDYQQNNISEGTLGAHQGHSDGTLGATNNNVNNVDKLISSDSSESEPTKKADKIPYQKVASLYKSILVDTGEPGMSLIDMQVLTTKRKAAIKKYWTREGKHGLERVEGYFNWIWNNRGDHSWIFGTQGKWKADLEYLLREETIAKAREQRLGNFGGNQQ